MTLLKSQRKAQKEKEKQRLKQLKVQEERIEKHNKQKRKQLRAEASPKSCQQSIRYKYDIVNIGLHFFLKNIRPYAISCSEA